MKVGDLVRCKYVDGKPMGLVVEVRNEITAHVADVLVRGQIHPFSFSTLEIIK